MSKRQQRKRTKSASIIQAARELFAARGVEHVSMDEIAATARVSKVTIYKYFGSKDELYAAVVNAFMEEALSATERVFNSDVPFIDKLKFALGVQGNLARLVSYTYIFQVWEQDSTVAQQLDESYRKVKALMHQIIDEGKRTGYIEPELSFDLLYLYAEIFRAGLRAKSVDLDAVLHDPAQVEQLYNLYFFGFVKRQPG